MKLDPTQQFRDAEHARRHRYRLQGLFILRTIVAVAILAAFVVIAAISSGCATAPDVEKLRAELVGVHVVHPVVSDSMLPEWKRGDRFAVIPWEFDSIKPGMILAYAHTTGPRSHRAQYLNRFGAWVVQGTNNPVPDGETVTRKNFLGLAVLLSSEN